MPAHFTSAPYLIFEAMCTRSGLYGHVNYVRLAEHLLECKLRTSNRAADGREGRDKVIRADPSARERPMERRKFVSMAAGATMALALQPVLLPVQQEAKSPTPYPDPAVEVVDPRFAKYQIASAAVERLWTGARWAEGPVWVGDGGYSLFSDIPNNRMLRWLEETGEVTVFRSPSNYSNGNCRDRQGRLLTCEHDTRRVTRTEHDGTDLSADGWLSRQEAQRSERRGGPLRRRRSGSAILATASCRIMKGIKPRSNSRPTFTGLIRRRASQRWLSAIWIKPNGLCFSPDEKLLYMVDSGMPKHPSDPRPIRVYDVVDGVRLTNGRMFVNMSPGISDGIRCDVDGNVWSAAGWAEKVSTGYISSPRTALSLGRFIFRKRAPICVLAAPKGTDCS